MSLATDGGEPTPSTSSGDSGGDSGGFWGTIGSVGASVAGLIGKIGDIFKGGTQHLTYTEADNLAKAFADNFVATVQKTYPNQWREINDVYGPTMVKYVEGLDRWGNSEAPITKAKIVSGMHDRIALGDSLHGVTHNYALWILENVDKNSSDEAQKWIAADMHATIDGAIQKVTGQKDVVLSQLLQVSPKLSPALASIGVLPDNALWAGVIVVTVILLVLFGHRSK